MISLFATKGVTTSNPSRMLYNEKLYQELDEGCELLKRPLEEDKYGNQLRVTAVDNAAIGVLRAVSEELQEHSSNAQNKSEAQVKYMELPSLFWPPAEKNTHKRVFALAANDSDALYTNICHSLLAGPIVKDGSGVASTMSCEEFVKSLLKEDREHYPAIYRDMYKKISRLLERSKLEAAILLDLGKTYTLNRLSPRDDQTRKIVSEIKEFPSKITHRMACKAMLVASSTIFQIIKTDGHLLRLA